MRYALTGCLTLGLMSSVLQAQGMSDDELLNKLLGQLEVMGERTRGLRVVTGDNGDANATTEGGDGLTSLADIKPGTAIRVDETLEINVQIQFAFDSAALAVSEQPALSQMCRVMKQAENIQLFQIVGHTDASGSEAYNKRLSQLRANEVKRYLTSDCGIAETRLRAVGYGEEFPDNANDPRAPENRRVELQVLG